MERASANCADILGVDAKELLGTRMNDVLGQEIAHSLRNAVSPSSKASSGTGKGGQDVAAKRFASAPMGRHDVQGRAVYLRAFRHDQKTILELEPETGAEWTDSDCFTSLKFLLQQIQSADDADALCHLTADLIRYVTGFDRVLVYRFDAHHLGEVVAEARRGSLQAFLGLRVPHWDQSAHTSAGAFRFPIQVLADVQDKLSALVGRKGKRAAVDLSLAQVGAAAPITLDFAQALEAAASMTFSIVVDGRPWGLVACHHQKPKLLPAPQRDVLMTFLDAVSMKLHALGLKANGERDSQVRAIQRDIKDQMSGSRAFQGAFRKIAPQIFEVLAGQGAALAINDDVVTIGDTPNEAVIKQLIARAEATEPGWLAEDCLSEAIKAHRSDRPGCTGALILPAGDGRAMCLFRAETPRKVCWAGSPKTMAAKSNGAAKRKSKGSAKSPKSVQKATRQYIEDVFGHSQAWSAQDIDIAQRLSQQIWDLIDAVERPSLLEGLNRQQDNMIRELNHRVRNILALVRSVSQQSRRQTNSVSTYAEAMESRIQALAAAHDISTGQSANAVSLRSLIEQEVRPYLGRDTDRLEIDGPSRFMRVDRAPIFSLVIHELVTNAVKFGSLSSPAGRVDVELSDEDTSIRVVWKESEGPYVSLPGALGFGTTLIEHAIPHELLGSVSLDFDHSGVQVSMDLPKDVFDESGVETDAVPDRRKSRNTPANSTPVEGLTGLILEDNYIIAKEMRDNLMELGFEQVDSVSSVRAALDHINIKAPDFCVLDVNLGGMATSETVALDLIERGIYFVFVTGYSDVADLDARLRDVPILTKPVAMQDIKAELVNLKQTDPAPTGTDKTNA